MKGVIYEDDKYKNLLPLVWLRPVYDLVCGAMTLRQRIEKQLPDIPFIGQTRSYLGGCEKIQNGRTLFVNGRLLSLGSSLEYILASSNGDEFAFFSKGHLAGASLGPKSSRMFSSSYFDKNSLPKDIDILELEQPARMIDHTWNLISNNGNALAEDLVSYCSPKNRRSISCGSYILGTDLYCGNHVTIEPFCLLDTRLGPVFLDDGTQVHSHTVIRGPALIGKNCSLLGGEIGPDIVVGDSCKIHGEFKHSVMLQYSNVTHEGLVSHSYICRWVNIGAGTRTSDLKNTYGTIRVNTNGETIDTGLTKLGCFIADHAKTSTGSTIYPGKTIGIASHVYGIVTDNVPSFTIWGNGQGAGTETIPLESAMKTRERSMKRRQVIPSQAENKILSAIHTRTKGERPIKESLQHAQPTS